MLTELRIRNFAIIESLTLPLARGFNVLSGETGAGKSIIVGAIGQLLGDRANVDLIRSGADRALVEGTFDVSEREEIITALDERGIEVEDGAVVLKREISAAGRARAWINGTLVSASALADTGRMIVNLHGQHEAQTLLEPAAQLRILDAFAGATELAARVRAEQATLASVKREIAELQHRRSEAERRADYLRHVAEEIGGARLVEGEDTRLEDESRRLENAEELRELASGISGTIDAEDEGLLHRLGEMQRSLVQIQRVDPTLARLQELYDAAYYNLEALSRELADYESTVELDPSRLEEVRRRRDLLFRLSKKYGPSLSDVITQERTSRAELDLLDSASLDITQLEQQEAEARKELARTAAELSKQRKSAADRLGRAVDDVFPDLGMPDGHFRVALSALPEIGADGAESAEFRVALNAGHDDRPLVRVASGGELSRVMLALKTILARLDHVPTLIFDEVDAGIGGRVGLQVGETMRRVAAYHQVFAITHLPQIAARAHHHILVSKGARGGVTTADISVLNGNERVTEVARMLGGDAESETSRAHARELLENASRSAAEVAGPSRGKRSRSS